MPLVTMTVIFKADVEDGFDPDSLCLSLDADLVEVETTAGEHVPAMITDYQTVCVSVDVSDDPE